MRRRCWIAGLLGWLAFVTLTQAGVRIKDITDLEGVRGNQLVGLGLVVGLVGTGSKSSFTQQMAVDMLQRFNVTTRISAEQRGDTVFKSGNISAVLVTTELGPFNRKGSRLDVTISALDEATSLEGGTLIFTPLKGADNVVYAVAQGSTSTGGFSVGVPNGEGGTTASARKNHPTVSRISGGAIVECEARGNVVCNGQIRLQLREPDPVTARAIAKVINGRFPNTAVTVDAGTVQVFVPEEHLTDVTFFIGDIGVLEVTPDVPARVIINERTGTIVAGAHVKIDMVAVTHSNLSIATIEEKVVSQPAPFSRGKTTVTPTGQVAVAEQSGMVRVLDRTVTVAELARALNALGATPRDLIVIFQSLKRAGALHADLIFM